MVLQMRATLAQKDTLISALQHQLLVLRRRQFGRSSEQVDKQIHQIELQLEELEIQAAETPEIASPSPTEKRTPKRRVALPAHLPRDERRVEATTSCPDCHGELRHIGDDVSEVLDVVPASYRVIKIIRPKYDQFSPDVQANLASLDRTAHRLETLFERLRVKIRNSSDSTRVLLDIVQVLGTGLRMTGALYG